MNAWICDWKGESKRMKDEQMDLGLEMRIRGRRNE